LRVSAVGGVIDSAIRSIGAGRVRSILRAGVAFASAGERQNAPHRCGAFCVAAL